MFFSSRIIDSDKYIEKKAEFNINEWSLVYPSDPQIQTLIANSIEAQEEIWLWYPQSDDDYGFRKVVPQSINVSKEGNVSFFSKKKEGGMGSAPSDDDNKSYSLNKVGYFLFKKDFLGVDEKQKEIVDETYVDSFNGQNKDLNNSSKQVKTEDAESNAELPYDSQLDIIDNTQSEDSEEQNQGIVENQNQENDNENFQKVSKRTILLKKYN
jgi:hypothetical protein